MFHKDCFEKYAAMSGTVGVDVSSGFGDVCVFETLGVDVSNVCTPT